MTKKKMKKTIIVGILMFYTVSCAIMLLVLEDSQEDKFRSTLSNLISSEYVGNLASHFDDINIDSKEKSDEVAEMFMHLYANGIRGYMAVFKRPFSLAIQDREGNITYLHDNYFYWQLGDDVCVSLDEHLTDEIRKELKEVRKDKYNALVDELRLYFDGEKYIPVEAVFRGQGNFYSDYRNTVKFTDYEPNKTIVNNPVAMSVVLRELETEFYNRPYYAKLKDLLNREYDRLKDYVNERFGTEFGNYGYSGSSGSWYGNMNVAIGDGYRMYFAFRYNSYLVTLFSDDYQTIMILLAFAFSIAGLIFYIMCMRVIEKSKKLDEAKSTFISGASHELKTPLAVIQNQCECIMENIAPEKNEEYIKSIYDEALRMNGIVSSLLSYSRLTQMTAVKKERCNLSELLREEVRNYRKFAENSGVTIVENIAGDIYADCNAQLMKMAFGNYISNAVKYAADNKVVDVRLSKNTVIVMEVVNPAHKENADIALGAWDEFSRGDVSRQRQGASIGMGLPICKKIFELHGFGAISNYKDGLMTFKVHIS